MAGWLLLRMAAFALLRSRSRFGLYAQAERRHAFSESMKINKSPLLDLHLQSLRRDVEPAKLIAKDPDVKSRMLLKSGVTKGPLMCG